MEASLGRVINPESAGKERTQWLRSVVLALRELMHQTETNAQTRDLTAYIALALDAVAQTIDSSVEAWEKRGYWLKADRFRMEWAWCEKLGGTMRQAILSEDWMQVAITTAQVMERLKDIKVPARHQLGTPWVGAWEKLNSGR